jgi:hypothetical protein
MPSANGTYSTSEMASYSDGPCPQCGGKTSTEWIPVKDADTPEDRWLPGAYRCANPRQCSTG